MGGGGVRERESGGSERMGGGSEGKREDWRFF